jgi:tryptophan halogenase
MARQIKHITIVGGGTAGWMTAALLNSQLNPPGRPQKIKISLIESPNIKTVGVGEATVPGMRRTVQAFGIDEREFVRRCNVTFKLGVDFVDWNRDENGAPVSYVNPFSGGRSIKGVDSLYYFHRFGRRATDDTRAIDPIEATTPTRDAMVLKKGPRRIKDDNYAQQLPYAYHLDAGLFAQYLAGVSVRNGIEHIRDDVVNVNLDERGFVASLDLKECGNHPIEFVIDCTGFKGLIINEALGEPFVPYSKYLLNDRALAVQIPHKNPKDLLPGTRSTALGAGWVWRVPLQSRIGTGYVFSSAHRTDEEATAEFLKHLGLTEEEAQPRAIPIRVGRTRRAFVKNCLAVGLASGFIEPLESTAIHMIDMATRYLFAYFPDMDFDEKLLASYNRVAEELYDEVRDFIVLHYCLNNRTDTDYWRTAREDMPVPDRLAENLEVWKYTLPSEYDLPTDRFFGKWNYEVVLFGKGFYPKDHVFPIAETLDEEDWKTYIREFRTHRTNHLAQLPGHHELVTALRNEQLQPSWAPNLAGTVPLPGMSGGPKAPVMPQPVSNEGALL